ncbi:MAG: 2-oxoacid:acceptor oxidoreductase subunit alpha [Rhodothermales bacterium]|nr:2-oxoacid:acceptor oxidoreductase subunit alpha [Rhodothermales bacterium]
MQTQTPEKSVQVIPEATILFAGDSGDGMQLTGSQFTLAAAYARNDLATLPDFPAEIRAPAGTTYGVSGFQLRFGSIDIRTPGDDVDLLVAMNPAALKVNLNRVSAEGSIIVNIDAFEKRNLELAGYDHDPLDDIDDLRVIPVKLTSLTREALKDTGLNQKEIDRSKNMFALGLALWLYSRPIEPAIDWISRKFAKKPDLKDANIHVLKKGFHYGETTEQFIVRYDVAPAEMKPGKYRAIRGAQALALGLAAARQASGLPLFYGSYPITPASDILHELSKLKHYGIATFQAEDEIAAIGAALGASFGGCLGVTATSGPGLALKSETLGLAVMTELPLVVIDMQRGGPSTGLPTKTEQSDLLQALYGRNGEAPLPVLAASTPGDCFDTAYEACRIAITYMTPVVLLADGYLGNGAEPWLIPDPEQLPEIRPTFADPIENSEEDPPTFLPYVRSADTMARPWAKPGTIGLEHRIGGLEKEDRTGNVSYDEDNHQLMTHLRARKVAAIAETIPPTEVCGGPDGDVLIVGWGSTRGAIEAAVAALRAGGARVSSVHLRYIQPLPSDLSEIFDRFDKLLVPEINDGQLIKVLRARYLRPFQGLNKVKGMPFKAVEIENSVRELLG